MRTSGLFLGKTGPVRFRAEGGPMSDELESFVGRQTLAGTHVDSGSFGLDSLRARHKLAEYLLPQPGLWLVKLVQAAVALEAPKVVIQFGLRSVTVAFDPSLPLQAEDLLGEVMAGSLPAERGLFHLVTGIRSSAGSSTETVTWSAGGTRVRLDAEGTTVLPDPTEGFRLTAERPYRTRSLAKTLSTPLSHLVRQTADEYEAVASRCWVCPIPVLLDGMPLRTGYDSPRARPPLETPAGVIFEYQSSRQMTVFACLAVRHLAPLPQRPTLPKMAAGRKLQRPVYKGGSFFSWPDDTGAVEAGAVITLLSHYCCTSQLLYVLDGAVVQSVPLEHSAKELKILGFWKMPSHYCGIRVLLPVEKGELDLSQFAVRNEPELRQRLVPTLLPQIRELLETTLRQLSSFYYVPTPPRVGKAVSVIVGVQATALTITAPLALVPLTMMVGAVGGFHVMVYRGQVKLGLQALLRSIDEANQPPAV